MFASRAVRTRLFGLVGAVSIFASALFLEAGPAAGSSMPFQDSASVGRITFCDVNGKEMTKGSVDQVPFAWRAVGSTPGTGPYGAKGATATLFGFQPIQNVDPANWFGRNMTGTAKFTDLAHPMAAATPADMSLATYLLSYPTKWAGLVQVRMYLGAPQNPTYTETYNSATIKVTGKNWTLVDGGGGSCSTGTAVSNEMSLPSVAAMPTPGLIANQSDSSASGKSSAGAGTRSASTGSTSIGAGSGAVGAGPSGSTQSEPASADDSTVAAAHTSAGGASAVLITIVTIVVVGVVGGVAWFVWTRRRSVADQ